VVAKIKITVAKRTSNGDLIAKYGNNVLPQCDALKDGQEFISEGFKVPLGFCPWAWADIQRDVAVLACGGNFEWVNQKGLGFSSCTDGFRPVVFRLERVE